MKILKFEADDCINVTGNSLQGHINTTFDKLCEIFGDPTSTDADPREKVNCEWTVEAEVQDEYDPDETVTMPFTVYCWKYGRIPTEECEWNIGGRDFNAYCVAEEIINAKN